GRTTVWVMQHGFAHVDYARRRGEGAWELGLHRPIELVLAEAETGHRIMQDAFGTGFLPVMAAPWNRIDGRLMPGLRDGGFVGVSAYGERPLFPPLADFVEANIHVDPLRWRACARFRGEASALEPILGHLRRRRTGLAESSEPTG